MFVVGAGLSTREFLHPTQFPNKTLTKFPVENAADSFLSICGPLKYSEIRLNLAQVIQATGSFVAPLLGSHVFFAKTVETAQGLKNVRSYNGFILVWPTLLRC
jgi:FHS family L-fucose permease-like MFS transporter